MKAGNEGTVEFDDAFVQSTRTMTSKGSIFDGEKRSVFDGVDTNSTGVDTGSGLECAEYVVALPKICGAGRSGADTEEIGQTDQVVPLDATLAVCVAS